MQLYPVKIGVVYPGDDLVDLIVDSLRDQGFGLEDDDVLALASKIVSYSQNRIVKLADVSPSEEAKELAEKYGLDREFAELVLCEAEKVYGGVEKAVLTLKDNVMTANAGIDSKNASVGSVVLWPVNLSEWLKNFRDRIIRKIGRRLAVVVVDSGLVPLRIGTVGLALAVAGFNPIREYRGRKDLFGKPIMITRQAVADDLACSAHLLMGEAAEKTSVVLIRGAPLDFDGNVHGSEEMMMPFKECIFMSNFEK